jgi:uncharacterized ion transporter superfamily protein YfcC
MNNLSPQRRRVVVLAASVAGMSAAGSVLLKGHRWLLLAWIAFLVVALVYTISELIKLKRSEHE